MVLFDCFLFVNVDMSSSYHVLSTLSKNVFFSVYYEEKSCEAGLAIGIVLDKPLSVKQQNLQNAILNLRDMINKSNPAPDADHFGLITINNQQTLAFGFKDSTFYNKTALLKRIGQEPIAMKRWTRIDMVLEMVNRTLFSSQGGHRPEKPSLMIVFTDGVQAPKGGEKFKAFVDKIIYDLEASGNLNWSYSLIDLNWLINHSYVSDTHYKKHYISDNQ